MSRTRGGERAEVRRVSTAGPPRLWPLAVLAVAVTVLAVLDVVPRWPGMVHLVALPPLDLFADLRVLLIRAESWPQFILLLIVVAAMRVIVMATMLGGLDRVRIRLAVLFYAAAFPLLLIAAQIDFIAYALLYSRLFWPAVMIVALLGLVFGPVPWQGADRLRGGFARAWRRGLRVKVTLPYGAALVLIGVLADRSDALAVALVPVSALATAIAVRALTRPPTGPPMAWLAAAAAAALLASTVFVMTREVAPAPSADQRPGSLLIMSGINSRSGVGAIFSTDNHRLGYPCDQVYYFSYAGPGDGQPQRTATCPIRTGAPYVPDDTQRPVQEQVDAFAAQVGDLPRPLVVAAHSHAAWIAWEAIATGRAPTVDVLILVGPFPESPIGYLPPDEDRRGRVASDLTRLLVPLADLVDFEFAPDSPGALELLARANGGGAVFQRSLPDEVRTLSVTSATDLPLMPEGWRLPVDRNACPLREAHPYLPITHAFYHEVNRFLDGAPPPPCPVWRDWGVPMSRPFGVPPDRQVTYD
jgi:hypothetical protein